MIDAWNVVHDKMYPSPYDRDKMLLSFIEAVNCNKGVPENHNFLISNLYSNSAEVYQNGLWVTVDKKKTLQMFFEHKVRELDEKENLKNGQKVYNYDSPYGILDKLEDYYKWRDSLVKKVERLIYSHREMIKETKRQSRVASNNNICHSCKM